jgi:hypothetical protein
MYKLGGPSMLIAGGLVLGSWGARLHNVLRHEWCFAFDFVFTCSLLDEEKTGDYLVLGVELYYL